LLISLVRTRRRISAHCSMSAYTSVPPAGSGDGEIPIFPGPRPARLCASRFLRRPSHDSSAVSRPCAWRRGWPRRAGGGVRTQLAGHAGVVEGLCSRHTRQVAYPIIGGGLAAAALLRPRREDRLELEANQKLPKLVIEFLRVGPHIEGTIAARNRNPDLTLGVCFAFPRGGEGERKSAVLPQAVLDSEA